MHRVLVTGDRNWSDRRSVAKVMSRLAKEHGAKNVLVIAGGCRGLDTIAEELAKGQGIHVARIDALWNTYHRGAGPTRNGVMLSLDPDEVIAFHDDIENSSGTANCLGQARKRGIARRVVTSGDIL